MSEIPIANVYYLLLYAWRHTQQREIVDLSGEAGASLPNLFANVLEVAVARLIARGLDRSYVPEPQVVAGVRGRLDVGVTLRRSLLPIGRTYCHVDELRHDVLHNRIIKATLRKLLALANLDSGIRDRVRRLHGKMDAVTELALAGHHFRSVQLHRNVRAYDFHPARLSADP